MVNLKCWRTLGDLFIGSCEEDDKNWWVESLREMEDEMEMKRVCGAAGGRKGVLRSAIQRATGLQYAEGLDIDGLGQRLVCVTMASTGGERYLLDGITLVEFHRELMEEEKYRMFV